MIPGENIINVINAGLSVYLVAFFYRIFAAAKYNRYLTLGAYLLSTAAMSATLITVENIPVRMLIVISISVFMAFVFKLSMLNRLLLPLIMYAISGAAEYLTFIALAILFPTDIQQNTYSWLFVLGIFLSKITIFIILTIVRIQKHKVFHGSLSKKYLTVFFIPISTFAVFLIMYRYYLANPTTSASPDMVDLLCCLLLVIANIVSFNIIDGIYLSAEASAKLTLVSGILNTKEEQYKELMYHNQTILKLRHDHKNFLLGILSCIDSGKLDVAREHIARELDIINSQHIPPLDSSIVHTVMYHKEHLASKHGIKFEHEYHDIQKICIPPTDIAIILGNALDNAIEACSKIHDISKRIVSVYIRVHGGHVLMILKNPVKENVDLKGLESSKNSMYHGFGIMSMKNIASQYEGEVIFSREGDTFETYIMMNNHSADNV